MNVGYSLVSDLVGIVHRRDSGLHRNAANR